MKRRQNGILGTSISLTALTGLGVGGWVAFRLYVRERLLEELQKEGLSETFRTAAGVAALLSPFVNVDLNLPPPVALARTMVPIWSTVMPEEALRDISENGRQSQYWPPEYREPNQLLESVGAEKAAFRKLGEAIG